MRQTQMGAAVIAMPLLLISAVAQAQLPSGTAVKGDWGCAGGMVTIEFTVTNGTDADIEVADDELPWSSSGGGARIYAEAQDDSKAEINITRRPADHSTRRTIRPGDTSDVLEVSPLLPHLRSFISQHGKVMLTWTYAVGTGKDQRWFSEGVLVTADPLDPCFVAAGSVQSP